MKYKIRLLSVLILFCLNTQAENSEQHDHHHEHDHAAHVHGLANLTLAIENNLIEAQLESPAVNLVGFEHRASTPEERSKVEKVETILQSPERVFTFTNGECKQNKVIVDTSAIQYDDHQHHEHENEHKEGHTEITAEYHFKCADINNLKTLSTLLFNEFPGIEKINAMWITETHQEAALLTKDNNNIPLK